MHDVLTLDVKLFRRRMPNKKKSYVTKLGCSWM